MVPAIAAAGCSRPARTSDVSNAATGAGDPNNDILIADPANPASLRVALEGDGAIGPVDWSADGRTLLLQRYVSVAKSHIYSLDVASGTLSEISERISGTDFTAAAGLITEIGDRGLKYNAIYRMMFILERPDEDRTNFDQQYQRAYLLAAILCHRLER